MQISRHFGMGAIWCCSGTTGPGPPVDLCSSVLNFLVLTPSFTLRTQIIEQTITPTISMKMVFPCHSRHASFPPFRNWRDMMSARGPPGSVPPVDHCGSILEHILALITWFTLCTHVHTYLRLTWNIWEILVTCRFLSWRFVFCHGREQTWLSCLAGGTPKGFKWRQTLLWQADSSSGSLIQYCQYFT